MPREAAVAPIPPALRVLVACEFSGAVRRAFAARGHDVWSCDLLPAEDGSNRHIRCDVREILGDGWDLLMVAHPPCTRLCNSGVRWLHAPPAGRTLAEMWQELDDGADLFSACWNAPVDRIAIENPVMHRHAKARIRNYAPATQTVQPWWFGEPYFKATGFYLKGLPPLTATGRISPPKPGTAEHKAWSHVHRMSPGPERWKERSRTFPGMAGAMAHQWGNAAASLRAREGRDSVPLLITEREAMAELGIRDRAVLLDEIEAGALRFVRVGKRRKYTRADLDEFVERKRKAWDSERDRGCRDGATGRKARRTGTMISGSGVIGIEEARERIRRQTPS